MARHRQVLGSHVAAGCGRSPRILEHPARPQSIQADRLQACHLPAHSRPSLHIGYLLGIAVLHLKVSVNYLYSVYAYAQLQRIGFCT